MTHEQLSKYLGAYVDGELSASQERAVKEHLNSCAICQDDLEVLQRLSAGLKLAPVPPVSTPPAQLIAVSNPLPENQAADVRQKPFAWVWWIVPVGIVTVWVLIRSTSIVLNATTWLGMMGVGGEMFGWMFTPVTSPGWLISTLTLIHQDTGVNPAWLRVLGNGELLGWSLVIHFIIWLALAGLFWAWFVLFWTQRKRSLAAQTID